MAITKNPLIRYKILDTCFRNPYKKFTKELLLEKVNNDLFEITGNEKSCIKLRQLQDDIAFMKSVEGWNVELADYFEGKKRIYRYESLNFSIINCPLNEMELDEFQTALQVLSQFEGMPQFEGIQEIIAKLKSGLPTTKNTLPFISFDSNQDLKGIEFFSPLYHATQNQQPLEITYKDFKSEDPYTFVFHPHFLKEYNNRWFLFGLHEESQKENWNIAIDRIIEIKSTETIFIPTKIDWQDYFTDMIGVSKSENQESIEVVLHFYGVTGRYMENKSIHETQKHKWIDENTLELKIKVIPNYELERLLLSYGESVKVVSPPQLVEKIKSRIRMIEFVTT